MSKEMIGDVPGNVLGMLEDLFLKLRKGVLSPDELELFLKKKNPFALPSDLLIDWQNFWKRMGIDADLRKVKIPKKPKGFDRLLVNPLTPQKAYELCASKFKCWKYSNESLDKIVVHEDRTAKDGAYAVWVRERVEPDEELKGKSANDLVGMKVFGNTLTEALVYKLKFNYETGQHLNLANWNLCSGSRDSDGLVPYVYPTHSFGFLRSRQTVS